MGCVLVCGIWPLVWMARCSAQPQRAALILEQAKQGKLLQASEEELAGTNSERNKNWLVLNRLGPQRLDSSPRAVFRGSTINCVASTIRIYCLNLEIQKSEIKVVTGFAPSEGGGAEVLLQAPVSACRRQSSCSCGVLLCARLSPGFPPFCKDNTQSDIGLGHFNDLILT